MAISQLFSLKKDIIKVNNKIKIIIQTIANKQCKFLHLDGIVLDITYNIINQTLLLVNFSNFILYLLILDLNMIMILFILHQIYHIHIQN
jgi:hypothetical protein